VAAIADEEHRFPGPCRSCAAVDEVAEGAPQLQGFAGEGTGGLNGAGVFFAQSLNPRRSQRQFLVPDALHPAYPGGGIELGHGEESEGWSGS
jgi:hypothetical protein